MKLLTVLLKSKYLRRIRKKGKWIYEYFKPKNKLTPKQELEALRRESKIVDKERLFAKMKMPEYKTTETVPQKKAPVKTETEKKPEVTKKQLEQRIHMLSQALLSGSLTAEQRKSYSKELTEVSKKHFDMIDDAKATADIKKKLTIGSDKTRGKDKVKRKQRTGDKLQHPLNQAQKKVSDANVKEHEIDEERKLTEGLREGETYYNEKPSEIMNVGKDFWSAKRHDYTTYEESGSTLAQMEKDGVAEKMVNKKTFLGGGGIADFDERVARGEEPQKVIYEAMLRDFIRNAPETGTIEKGYDEKLRQDYVNFTSQFNRIAQNTTRMVDLMIGLQQPIADLAKRGTDPLYGVVGKLATLAISPSKYKYLTWSGGLDKRERKKYSNLNKLQSDINNGVTMDATYAKAMVEGEASVAETGAVKKGSTITLKPSILEAMAVIKYKNIDEASEKAFSDARAKWLSGREKHVADGIKKIVNEARKDDEISAKADRVYDDQISNAGLYFKKKYLKKDGTINKNGEKRWEKIFVDGSANGEGFNWDENGELLFEGTLKYGHASDTVFLKEGHKIHFNTVK